VWCQAAFIYVIFIFTDLLEDKDIITQQHITGFATYELKLGEFDHSDAGQMNMYLNYYKENESASCDNDPIGIILCSGKNEALVKYATMGLPQQVFVSKYLINLPSVKELQKIIEKEKEKRL
jgi:hypothetical protein